MTNRAFEDRFSTHAHRLVTILGYLLILVFFLRRRYDMAGGSVSSGLAIFLFVSFTVLYASESLISRHNRSYRWIYFILQLILVQGLGLFQDYQDTWAVLYIVLGFQVSVRCARKEALVWFSLFMLSLLATLSFEFGFVSGVGRALAYVVIGVLIISFDIQYSQHEDALIDSQMLLSELQEANQKLAEYAAQAKNLAAVQERNRMIQELHDSVGQKIFAIQLAAEATQLLLGENSPEAAEQMDNLQAQTQSALNQMRQLIGQWRPG